MAVVKVIKNTYTADPLYQWDSDQVLEVRGLSLVRVPEVHFSNTAMSRAIVRPATMDAAGILRVDVPNTLLQKPYTINVYLCDYVGGAFQTLHKLEIPVKARPQPEGYTFQDTAGEIYSFEALEELVYNAEHELRAQYAANSVALKTAQDAAVASAASANAAENAAAAAATKAIENAILKSDIVEIVKVSELPTSPAADVLYIIV